MKLPLVLYSCAFLLVGCATGPTDAVDGKHQALEATATAPSPAQMDAMTKSMQEMHDRMMAAQTPQERAKLMGAHMKLMQDGMGMIGRLHGGRGQGRGMGGMGMGMGANPEMMGRRMDMMEMMMQMMMDREVGGPPAAPAK